MTAQPSSNEIAVQTGMVASDVLCIRCGYNLRTLPEDGVCPECATPVRSTLAHHNPVSLPTLFLVRLRWGLRLTLAYWLLTFAIASIQPFALRFLDGYLFDAAVWAFRAAFFVLPLLAWWRLLLLAGDAQILRPQPQHLRSRTLLIVVTHAVLAYEMLNFFDYLRMLSPWRDEEGLAGVAVLIADHVNYQFSYVLLAALLFLLYGLFAVYAERLNKPGLRWHFRLLRWLAALQCLISIAWFYGSGYMSEHSDSRALYFTIMTVVAAYGLTVVVWAFIVQLRLYLVTRQLLKLRPPMRNSLRTLVPAQVRQMIWFIRKLPVFLQYHGKP